MLENYYFIWYQCSAQTLSNRADKDHVPEYNKGEAGFGCTFMQIDSDNTYVNTLLFPCITDGKIVLLNKDVNYF